MLAAIGPTTEMIRAAALPLPPLALTLAVVVELGGGLLLVSGFWTRTAATALGGVDEFDQAEACGEADD
jgi:putative oxidoreductase